MKIVKAAAASIFELTRDRIDRTDLDRMSRYWSIRQQRLQAFSAASQRIAICSQSLGAHAEHCRKHPKDKEAEVRLARLVLQERGVAPPLENARIMLNLTDKEYRRRVVEIAGVPPIYRSTATVDILDGRGSVRIRFGPPLREQQAECWVLWADGTLTKKCTPLELN